MMYPETIDEYGKQLPYFRTNEFSEMMIESESLLKGLIGTDSSSKVAFFTMSGSGAMEASVTNIFTKRDKVLIINGGSFGQRFEDICVIHNIPFESIKLDFGKQLSSVDIEKFGGKGFTGMLVNMDETSTGQLYDVEMLSSFCRKEGMVLVVDAISSFLADRLEMDKMNIDVVILSSQKGLSLEPGISIVIVNEKTFENRVQSIDSHSLYMDIKLHVENQKRGQTPFTPAVGTLIAMNRMLKQISKNGIETKIKRTNELATYFRENIKAIGLRIPDYPLSNAVTPIILNGNAYDLFKKLRDVYDITITPNGGSLSDTVVRVGHMGNLDKCDYDILIDAMKEVLQLKRY